MNKKFLFSVLAGLLLMSSCSKDVVVNPVIITPEAHKNMLPVEQDGWQYGYRCPFIIRPIDNADYGKWYETPVWVRYENSTVDKSYKIFEVQFLETRIILKTDVPLSKRITIGLLYDYRISKYALECYEDFVEVKANEVPLYDRDYYKYSIELKELLEGEKYTYNGQPTIDVRRYSYSYKDDFTRSFANTFGGSSFSSTKEFIEIPRNLINTYN